VNRVLGDGEALRRLFPTAAVERWTREWRDHASARPALTGYAELRHAEGEEGRFAATRRIVEETQALARGLSVAVLVQKNSTAARLADYLRREGGLPAVAESDQQVATDNPFSCALLALCQAAAHPGDRAAWEQVQMTPLATVLTAEGVATPEALSGRLLGEIHGAGFERTLETWVWRLDPQDEFSRERGRQLVEAARLFDETGSRDVAEFGLFAARHTARDADTAAVVRVMTVHKAKGLGFDVVILPDLQGTKLAARRRGLAVQRAADRGVEWVLDMPPETFFAPDAVLATHVAEAEAEACYEELAVLYVAMTRAKRALHVITEPVVGSKSHNFPRLLQETLGDEWESGDRHWFQQEAPPPAEPLAVPDLAKLEDEASGQRVNRRPTRAPSGLKSAGEVSGARLFALETRGAVEFGREVHAWLAAIEWGGAAAEGRLVAAGGSAAAKTALACLRAQSLAGVWILPVGADRAEVWREQAFEVVLDGAWVTGVLDRVVIECDEAGRAQRAAIYDFKTDMDEEGALARHAGQMKLYRQAVARLTGLAPARVAAALVLAGSCQLVPVAAED
jgi:ATP-dependent helicase/nuclease subunit A